MLGWTLAIWGTMHRRGPFLAQLPTDNTLSLQYFFLIISIPLTFLGVVIREAENSQIEVRENEPLRHHQRRAGDDLEVGYGKTLHVF